MTILNETSLNNKDLNGNQLLEKNLYTTSLLVAKDMDCMSGISIKIMIG